MRIHPFHPRALTGWILALGLLAADAAAAPPPGAAPQVDVSAGEAEARARFEKGVAHFDQQAYREALEEFRKSLAAKKTRNAMGYAASCLKQLGQYDDALEQYEEMRREYPKLPARTEKTVAADMAELAGLVGTLVVTGDAPAGASLVVDERLRGKLPLDKPLRLAAGSRALRLEKEGFDPITLTVEVKAGQQNTAQLVARTKKGRLRISERHNWPLAIELDGKDTGAVTPWDGLVDPGEHTVRLRGFLDVEALLSCEVPGAAPGAKAAVATQGAKMESAVKTASVRLYEVEEVVLGAEDQDASLKVESAPSHAVLRIDNEQVGLTPWEGRLPLGKHTIEVLAKGYFASTQQVKLERRKQREVTLALDRVPEKPGFWTGRTVGAAAAYGVGVLGLGAFAVAGGLAVSTSAELKQGCPGGTCPGEKAAQRDEAQSLGSAALAGLIVGGAGAVAGTVVLLAVQPQAPPRRPGATGATGPTWTVGAGLGGLVVEGSF